MFKEHQLKSGYTWIELLIVLSILMILSLQAIPSFTDIKNYHALNQLVKEIQALIHQAKFLAQTDQTSYQIDVKNLPQGQLQLFKILTQSNEHMFQKAIYWNPKHIEVVWLGPHKGGISVPPTLTSMMMNGKFILRNQQFCKMLVLNRFAHITIRECNTSL